MKNKLKIGIVSGLAVGIALLVFLFILSAPTAVLVVDPAWQVVLPEESLSNFKKAAISSKCRPKVIECTTADIMNPETLKLIIQEQKKARIIILSPLEAAAIMSIPQAEENLKEQDSKTIIAAITKEEAPFADLVLQPDYESGWNSVPEELKDKCVSNSDISKAGLDLQNSYIVDYRYSKALPAKQIYGVIAPDFAKTLKELLNNSSTGKLYHEYYKN